MKAIAAALRAKLGQNHVQQIPVGKMGSILLDSASVLCCAPPNEARKCESIAGEVHAASEGEDVAAYAQKLPQESRA